MTIYSITNERACVIVVAGRQPPSANALSIDVRGGADVGEIPC